MSPKNQVRPLSHLCVRLISEKLIEALSDDEGKNYDAAEAYLSEATYEIVQDLLKNILNSANLDAATRFSCLQVLLRQDVKQVSTGIFPTSYYEAILKVIARSGTGLQQLNLKGVWARDHPTLLSELVGSLTKLKVLIIPHMADDSVLDAIMQCKALTVLDIAGECCFTANGLRNFKIASLTVLDIGMYGKKDVCHQEDSGFDVMADLIENMPNLVVVKTYSFTGQALNLIHIRNCNYKTKLKYLHDTGTTWGIIDTIVHMCPHLESINIDTPEEGVVSKLAQLRMLHSLKLVKASVREVTDFLQASGLNIQVLKLNHNKDESLDLSELCILAPNLHTLECFQMNLTFVQLDNYFMALQSVEILYCDIPDSAIKCILTNSPFLKRIVIGCAIHMTDGDIFRLCAESEFISLEELWFSCARGLTSTTVELLMGHCANLKFIGQLTGWDIHKEEMDYLRSVILYTNTNLTLLPLEYGT